MNAIQKRCRPKHQVLVLNCYPKTTKGAIDVKPNSSELSYLLFYATSRRSKIHKVGSFLEKKTASDVWRLRIGNVQVTLQILAALIEKSPKDMPLFGPYVLKVLELVLKSNDMTMVESSLPTLATFCEHHDVSTLQADQEYLQQCGAIIRSYCSLASTVRSPGKAVPTKPVAMRWRKTGLEAIKSIALSEALSSVLALQLDVMVPMILENLWTNNPDLLDVFWQRAVSNDEADPEKYTLKRRSSVALAGTKSTVPGDTNPIALSGSAVDVDKLDEEDLAVLAMQCLKQIFEVPNRPQIIAATAALLKFIQERLSQNEVVVDRNSRTGQDYGWALKILDIVTRWCPVQERYLILVTITETMASMQLGPETIRHHVVLAAMIGSLLRSDINLIGLSVMDVLLGLISQIRKLIHLPGEEKSTGSSPLDVLSSPAGVGGGVELLHRLERCIGDLATHVYYIDQISDMVLAVLYRLRPLQNAVGHAVRNPANTASSTTEPSDPLHGGTVSSYNLADLGTHAENGFAADIGKTSALRAVKYIFLVANPHTAMSGNVALLRNRVPISVWDDTEWLLRDPDANVRRAYAEALMVWLDRETSTDDLRAREDGYLKKTSVLKTAQEMNVAAAARRIVPNSHAKERATRGSYSKFPQLIHLAIYENALQYVDFEGDLDFLYVLLTKLVCRLGVNATRHGLPMMFRLQEDIQDVESPASKVRIGSLCHGYFFFLSETYHFQSNVVGQAIHNEVQRRRSKGFWVDGISYPPPNIENLPLPGVATPPPNLALREIESEALLPFDDRAALVEAIAAHYADQIAPPPTSPSSPSSNVQPNGELNRSSTVEATLELPSRMRNDMAAYDWTKENVLHAIAQDSRTQSMQGSRSGVTNKTHYGLSAGASAAAVAAAAAAGVVVSPAHSLSPRRHTPRPEHHQQVGEKLRNSSFRSGVSAQPRSTSSQGYVSTVEQLKQALVRGSYGDSTGPLVTMTRPSVDHTDDDDSDSVVSYEYSPSEISVAPPDITADGTANGGITRPPTAVATRPPTSGTGSLASSSLPPPGTGVASLTINDGLPPPPIQGMNTSGSANDQLAFKMAEPRRIPEPSSGAVGSLAATDLHSAAPPMTASGISTRSRRPSRRSVKSRGGDSATSRLGYSGAAPGVAVEGVESSPSRPPPALPILDLQALLIGIDSNAGDPAINIHTAPPY